MWSSIIILILILVNCSSTKNFYTEEAISKSKTCIELSLSEDVNVQLYSEGLNIKTLYFFKNDRIRCFDLNSEVDGIVIQYLKINGYFTKSDFFTTQSNKKERPYRFMEENITIELGKYNKINLNICENKNKYDIFDYGLYIFSPILFPFGGFPYNYQRLCIVQ
jgi:hypothetical protein